MHFCYGRRDYTGSLSRVPALERRVVFDLLDGWRDFSDALSAAASEQYQDNEHVAGDVLVEMRELFDHMAHRLAA